MASRLWMTPEVGRGGPKTALHSFPCEGKQLGGRYVFLDFDDEYRRGIDALLQAVRVMPLEQL